MCRKSSYFKGFLVKGTSGSSQYITRHTPFKPDDNANFTDVSRYSTDQGVLIMTDCTVKATVGSLLTGTDYTIQSENGGCLELYNSTFTNNYQCIKIKGYDQTSNDIADYNAFNIINCTFETTTSTTYTSVGSWFIFLDGVQRVQIEGCKFLNNVGYTSNAGLGRVINAGIRYQNSTFFLQKSGFSRQAADVDLETDCPEYNYSFARGNTFEGLPYGILGGTQPSDPGFSEGPFIIADCHFTNCLGGIHILNGKGGTIARNEYIFQDAHPYSGGLLNSAKGLGGTTNQIYFILIDKSKQIAITENKGQIDADDFPAGGTNHPILAAFVTIERLPKITQVTDQINIYKNSGTDGFTCSGSRTTTQTTYGVQLHSIMAGDDGPTIGGAWLNINCNDFTGLSNPIHFNTADFTLNSGNYLQNNGQTATMNTFVSCTAPTIKSLGGLKVNYRYFDTGTEHDPGTVVSPVTKKSTSDDFGCDALKCQKVAWGTAMEEKDQSLQKTISVFPNPTTGAFTLHWPALSEYKGLYEIKIFNSIGQLLHSQTTRSTQEVKVELPIAEAQLLLGTITTPTQNIGTFKLQVY